MHLTPAGLPTGIPGMADEMDGAMQHAPHPLRHSIFFIIQMESVFQKPV
jgi:hypothetical protein